MAFRRTGIGKILETGRLLCRLIVVWEPTILRFVNNDANVKAAFEAVMAACSLLESALSASVEFGD